KAQSRGAMIYLSNGQAIAAGAQQTANTIGGNAVTLNSPIADGDAGGSYNAGLILFYDPAGSPPAARFTGKVDLNGNVKIDSRITRTSDPGRLVAPSERAWPPPWPSWDAFQGRTRPGGRRRTRGSTPSSPASTRSHLHRRAVECATRARRRRSSRAPTSREPT